MHQVGQVLVNAIGLGSLYALLALGIALVYGIMGLINFAHGQLIMAGAYAILVIAAAPSALICVVTAVVVVLLAILMEATAFRPIRGADQSTLLVTSFAVAIFLENLAVLIFGSLAQGVSLLPSLNGSIDAIGLEIPRWDIAVFGVTVLLIGGLTAFMRRTSIGVQMRAAAENFEMARLLGVRANAVVAASFAISGLLAATAAIFLVAQSGTITPAIGLAPVVIAFIAVVIGGLGSLTGAACGGLFLGALSIALQTWLPADLRPFRDAFVYGLVIVVLIVRPDGFLRVGGSKVRV